MTEHTISPMLASRISVDTIDAHIADGQMVVSQKVDGDRLMVTVKDGKVTALNREGRPYSNPIPAKVLPQFAGLPGTWCFDGELLDELWLFDMPFAGNDQHKVVVPAHPYEVRLGALERIFSTWRPDPIVRLLPTARTAWAKTKLVNQVISRQGEGVVFRHVDSPYRPGKRSLHMLKAKFTKTIDCFVSAVAVEGKNNCLVSVYEDGKPVDIGSCAMLGKPAVRLNDVVEVRYLYADTNRRLVQTAFLRVRDDKPIHECTIDQLMFTDRTILTGGYNTMATTKRKEPGEGLGRTQVLVLRLLGEDAKSVRTLSNDGFGLSAGAVRGALDRLGRRGLVDRRFSYDELVYLLTKEGAEVEKALNEDEGDE